MSEERGAVERTIFIAAERETVFRFLIDPVFMAEWMGLSHTLEPAAGGIFRLEMGNGNVAVGVFTEVTPCRRVAFTWGWESADTALAQLKPGSTLVEIELEDRDGGTLLTLRHNGLPEGLRRIHGERWAYYLDRLQQAAVASAFNSPGSANL